MRITVVIPVYNVTAFLNEAVKSVVEQDYPDLEIIVVDDGSAPEHALAIKNICEYYPRVKLLRQQHRGTAMARDFGMAQSTSELIVFLDGDDILMPGALNYFAAGLRARPDAIAIYARYQKIDESGKLLGMVIPDKSEMHSGRELLESLLEYKIPFGDGSICIRKEALQRLSVNNHHLTIGENWVLWCHLALSGNIVPAGEMVTYHRRKHQQNVTHPKRRKAEFEIAACDTIFSHTAFTKALGKRKISDLKEKALSRIHTLYASLYAANSQPEKALHHFKQITLPMPLMVD